jgi:uncharacterized protein (DUF1810 family)
MAEHYGIASLAEARAYLAHPVLGPRLVECTELVNRLEGRSIYQIFGSPDDLKFHSSMTLFALVSVDVQVFREVLNRYFDGALDARTAEQLRHL